MKLFFTGHDEKFAIEQMLFTLFPAELPVYPAKPPGGEGELEVRLWESSGTFRAEARLRLGAREYFATEVRTYDCAATAIEISRQRRRCLQRAFYLASVQALPAEPHWGMLSGVRPVKLPTRWLMEGAGEAEAEARLREEFHVSPHRCRLAMDCARESMAALRQLSSSDVSLYIGIPFCPSRCAYCSFISAAGQNNRLMEPYLSALLEEIAAAGESMIRAGKRISSVYIGGGTPTTLSADQLRLLMSAIKEHFHLDPNIEYTVEAGRPDTITEEKLQVILDGGGNRISVNPQSTSDKVLQAMGRSHSASAFRSAADLVQGFGFRAVNMDLIAGLPEDSFAGFSESLSEVIARSPENITVHTLALKKGARLREDGGKFPSAETVSQMLSFAAEALRGAGYAPYYLYRQKYSSGSFENIGWCKKGFSSLYNICMMEELHTVLSLGAGGISKIVDYGRGSLFRAANPKYPQDYLGNLARILEEKDCFPFDGN